METTITRAVMNLLDLMDVSLVTGTLGGGAKFDGDDCQRVCPGD
jgi:hypothetical protein